MAEHGESETLLPKGRQSLQFYAGSKLDSTSRGNLDPVRSQRRIVSDGHQHRNVHQSAGGSSIEGEPQDGAAARSIEFRPDDNETAPRIE
jgi:hypothetical protein